MVADHTDRVEPGHVTFLEGAEVHYKGVRFIGATLWTDMKLFGDDWLVPLMVSRQLIDYERIRSGAFGGFAPEQVILRHVESLQFVEDRLSLPFDGPTVVITHHAPSILSIAERYRDDKMSAAFASCLDGLILARSPALWIHGHTHNSSDYRLGGTRVVCNPRGDPRRDPNERFDPKLLVEV